MQMHVNTDVNICSCISHTLMIHLFKDAICTLVHLVGHSVITYKEIDKHPQTLKSNRLGSSVVKKERHLKHKLYNYS